MTRMTLGHLAVLRRQSPPRRASPREGRSKAGLEFVRRALPSRRGGEYFLAIKKTSCKCEGLTIMEIFTWIRLILPKLAKLKRSTSLWVLHLLSQYLPSVQLLDLPCWPTERFTAVPRAQVRGHPAIPKSLVLYIGFRRQATRLWWLRAQGQKTARL
jgi:hypothetical protein